MKKQILLYCIGMLGMFTLSQCSKNGPGEPDYPYRYDSLIFDNSKIEKDVVYGSAVTQGGANIDLKMDIYGPEGDEATKRALIILAHGGSYVAGDKNEFSQLASFLSKSGYVVASVNYRLIDVAVDPTSLKKAIIDAIFDMKQTVAFFHDESAKYKIDVSKIFVGGYSAGAFTALHFGYLNSDAEITTFGGTTILDYVNSEGGLDGNGGNDNVGVEIKGVINIAGALLKAGFINSANDPALYSFHGTADMVVPYLEGDAAGSGIITQGAGLLHPVADNLGIANRLNTIQGGDHGVFFTYCNGCFYHMRGFLFELL